MKKLLIFAIVISICKIANCQSIYSDKKDPFTNTRTIITGINSLYKAYFTNILQVQSQIDIQNDSVTSYRLTFITPGLPLYVNTKDSLSNTCLLKDENDSIYSGAVNNEISGGIIKSIQGYSCTLSKESFYKIVAIHKITDVKITTDSGKGGLFSIDNGLQDNIPRQAKAMLRELTAYRIK